MLVETDDESSRSHVKINIYDQDDEEDDEEQCKKYNKEYTYEKVLEFFSVLGKRIRVIILIYFFYSMYNAC